MRIREVQARNRQSPYNEEDFIEAYKRIYPNADLEDDYDISAVVTMGGTLGHALMFYSYNRSHDNEYHHCYNFVSDDELKQYF